MSRLFSYSVRKCRKDHIVYISGLFLHRFFTEISKNVLTECAYIPKLKIAVNVSGNDSRNRCRNTKIF